MHQDTKMDPDGTALRPRGELGVLGGSTTGLISCTVPSPAAVHRSRL